MKLPKAEQRKIMEARDPSPIYEEEPKSRLFNIIIPIAPFDIPKYDNGGRFDLKAKYPDEARLLSADVLLLLSPHALCSSGAKRGFSNE